MSRTILDSAIAKLRGGLIVSCQAPADSPLAAPQIIAALALTAEQHGAAGVRINTPAHIAATKQRVNVPIIGIEKVESATSEVYITPTFDVARSVAESGADIVALDATRRLRPHGEKLAELIQGVQTELHRAVMADIATFDEGLYAADCGAALVATTLCSYTAETRSAPIPAFDLIERLAARLSVPIVCEGGVATPEDVKRAFDCGAFAVVVGAAITGIGQNVRRFVAAIPNEP